MVVCVCGCVGRRGVQRWRFMCMFKQSCEPHSSRETMEPSTDQLLLRNVNCSILIPGCKVIYRRDFSSVAFKCHRIAQDVRITQDV